MPRRGRIPLQKRKYLKKDSDRSGFTYFRTELVRDGAFLVHPNEKDQPPPSNESLGGEGDGNATGLRKNRNDVDHNPTVPDFT